MITTQTMIETNTRYRTIYLESAVNDKKFVENNVNIKKYCVTAITLKYIVQL